MPRWSMSRASRSPTGWRWPGGAVVMQPETLALIVEGRAKKGDVLGVAQLAGIMGAKRTADLIPLCHPLALTKVSLSLSPDPALPGIRIEATVRTSGRPGWRWRR